MPWKDDSLRTLMLMLVMTMPAVALTPAEIIIVMNKNIPESRVLADYYSQVRGVPPENIIALWLPTTEEMTREDYEAKLLKPLQEQLKLRKESIKCLLCMYGVPLRVAPKVPTPGEQAEADRLKKGLDDAKAKVASADAKTIQASKLELIKLEADIIKLEQRESVAAVDSELMLLWWPQYPLARWILNPLHWQMSDRVRKANPPAIMTARLDGPTPAIVKRMIDDAISVEKEGLKGNMYIDARGIAFDPKAANENGGYGYGGYDESFRETAALFKDKLTVTLDDKPELFAVQSCPNAALYCGWYSHGKYIDCCTYAKGAVAWHLASSEAVTLKRAESTLWCPNLLKAGVTATLGPVGEPYTVGFPKPAEFFGFLATGQYTLAEVNAKTLHFASWMMTCLGDPLYTPYKTNPLLKETDLFSSPKAGRPFFK